MPKLLKKEQEAQYSQLLRDTENFLARYIERHDTARRLRPSSLLPYNATRIQAASLIEKLSKHTLDHKTNLGEYDGRYRGKSKHDLRLELVLNALKGALVLALLNINQEDRAYKTTWTACFLKPTPLKETALFSLSLEALDMESLEAIPAADISKYLKKLKEYIGIMRINKLWEDAEAASMLANIDGILGEVQLPDESQRATAQ